MAIGIVVQNLISIGMIKIVFIPIRSAFRRSLLMLLAMVAGVYGPSMNAAPAAGRPNIVFVLTDDQRWDSLGLSGNSVVKTPHLDQLAAQGVWFEQATIASAICTPS